jgi:hypothetical protein
VGVVEKEVEEGGEEDHRETKMKEGEVKGVRKKRGSSRKP